MEADDALISNQVFNVGGNSQNISIREISDIIATYRPEVSIKLGAKGADRRDYNVNFNKIKSLLNFEPSISIRDGIKEIIEYVEFDSDVNISSLKHVNYNMMESLLEENKEVA